MRKLNFKLIAYLGYGINSEPHLSDLESAVWANLYICGLRLNAITATPIFIGNLVENRKEFWRAAISQLFKLEVILCFI